jgi:rhodanese-related sulfurtransferase
MRFRQTRTLFSACCSQRRRGNGVNACLLLPALIGLALATGCSNKVDDRDVQFVDTTSSAMEVMTKPRGALGLKGPPKSVWLDPRTEAAFAAGHIPDAVNLPFARLEAEHAIVLKDVELIVVYDAAFDDTLPKAVAKRLLTLGYKDVYVLRGGLRAWERDGNRVAKGAPGTVPGSG